MGTKTEQISVDRTHLSISQSLDGRSTIVAVPWPDGNIYCSVRRDHILHLRWACVCLCGNTAPVALLWFNYGYVVLERWGSYLGNSSLFYTDWLMGPENVTTQTLLYRCFSVLRGFLFQFWAGSSAFSSLNAYLVFSQQICLKIVLLLHCPERLKIDGGRSCAITRLKMRTKVYSIRKTH